MSRETNQEVKKDTVYQLTAAPQVSASQEQGSCKEEPCERRESRDPGWKSHGKD